MKNVSRYQRITIVAATAILFAVTLILVSCSFYWVSPQTTAIPLPVPPKQVEKVALETPTLALDVPKEWSTFT